jgi:hypothetical protein
LFSSRRFAKLRLINPDRRHAEFASFNDQRFIVRLYLEPKSIPKIPVEEENRNSLRRCVVVSSSSSSHLVGLYRTAPIYLFASLRTQTKQQARNSTEGERQSIEKSNISMWRWRRKIDYSSGLRKASSCWSMPGPKGGESQTIKINDRPIDGPRQRLGECAVRCSCRIFLGQSFVSPY